MDFGAYLRQARERQGVSLRQIAGATKIATGALEALERNDIGRLPGGIFTRAFVRAYAVEVGLDPEETVKQFLAQFPVEGIADGSPYASDSREQETFESQSQMARTFLRLVAISLPVAGVLVYFSMRGGRPEPAAPNGAAERDSVSAAPGDGRSAVPAAPGVPQDAPEAPSSVAPQEAQAALTVGLVPEAPCWVSVRVDGVMVVSRVMQPGEREVREARREILLSVGDAAAMALTINGRPGRPLGARGEVVTVRITPENFAAYVR